MHDIIFFSQRLLYILWEFGLTRSAATSLVSSFIQLWQSRLCHVNTFHCHNWWRLARVSHASQPLTEWPLLLLSVVVLNKSTFSVMKNSIDATEVNRGPRTDYRQYVAIFYVVYFVVFPFFFVNIFVALIIITFKEQGENELVDHELDKNQVWLFSNYLKSFFLIETVHWLCNQRSTTVSLYARGSQIFQISHLAISCLWAIWILHYDINSSKHTHINDESE